jgi:hypothetical protein
MAEAGTVGDELLEDGIVQNGLECKLSTQTSKVRQRCACASHAPALLTNVCEPAGCPLHDIATCKHPPLLMPCRAFTDIA